MPRLRAAPSGQSFNGTSGQILICQGDGGGNPGNIWEPGDPTSVGAIVGVGWDQPIEAVNVPVSVPLIELDRDSGGNPLQVNMGAVEAGQILEVEFGATFDQGTNPSPDAEFLLLVAVSFLAVPTFPDDFFFVADASTAVISLEGAQLTQARACLARAAATIPADAAQCLIRVGFTNTEGSFWSYGGTDGKNQNESVSLKGTLWRAGAVRQLGPGNLISLAP